MAHPAKKSHSNADKEEQSSIKRSGFNLVALTSHLSRYHLAESQSVILSQQTPGRSTLEISPPIYSSAS